MQQSQRRILKSADTFARLMQKLHPFKILYTKVTFEHHYKFFIRHMSSLIKASGVLLVEAPWRLLKCISPIQFFLLNISQSFLSQYYLQCFLARFSGQIRDL